MHVLLLNQVFYPDVAATAQHAHDLARHLVQHGHRVTAIASRSVYGEKGATLAKREVVDGIEIHRVGRSFFGKSNIAARALDFGIFYIAALLKALRVQRPDVMVCFTTPPFIALVGWLMKVFRRVPYVYWVMDLYPDVPVAFGMMKQGSPITNVFEALNRFCLRKASRVVVLGRCMHERILDKGIDPAKVQHIGVWADETEVQPIERRSNPYRAQWELGDRFVVMYSGNFGLAHDVQTMCEAARVLRGDDGVRFAFVGGGKRKAEVERFVREHGLSNCVVAPYQPREKLDESLSCADAHLVTLGEGMEGLIVPCKLFGIMAAARPTLYIGSPKSELARVLTEYDCGRVFQAGDVEGLVATIRAWRDDPSTAQAMGQRARQALSRAYARHLACEQWRELLEELPGAGGASEAVESTPARDATG